MIRLGDKIRLDSQERETLSTLVGFSVNPTSVSEHNQLLERANSAFACAPGETDAEALAEAELMAAVIGGMALSSN
jgi:hypothetical protein